MWKKEKKSIYKLVEIMYAKIQGKVENSTKMWKSSSEEAAESILSMIQANNWQEGHKLPPQRALAESLGVSRPTVREALDAFVNVTQQHVTGTARLKLYKGNLMLVGQKSPNSLYREDYATFGEEDVYNQKDAEGFIKLFGLPMKVAALYFRTFASHSFIKPLPMLFLNLAYCGVFFHSP